MLLGTSIGAVALAAPLAVNAQNGTENYYFPPKITTFGKSSLPVAGAGKVVVKVLVKADGTFTVANVVSSTNHGDDATALDIARHSTYHPAARGLTKKPVTAYYDFAVQFTGAGATADARTGASSSEAGGLGAPEAAMRAGKYSDAQTALSAYLQAHPGDQKALVDLGVTQVFLNDYSGAAATFQKVTSIPSSDKGVAVKAYSEASAAALKADRSTDAVADAKSAVALDPGPYSYNALGTAQHAAGDDASAIASLEKARDAAASLKVDERVSIDLNLLAVLLSGGKDDQAKPILAEINSLAPGNAGVQNIVGNHDIKLAQAADAAGNLDAGESAWAQAAAAVPSHAGSLYGHAAIDELNKKTGSDLGKAKAFADKGLAADPNDALANYAAGYVLAKQGKKSDALSYLNKADSSAKAGTDSSLTSGIESLIKQVNGS